MSHPDLQLEVVLRMVVAVILGGIIGVEREWTRHPAGVRTMALVAAGSSLFSSVGVLLAGPGVDVTRIAAQIVTGIGFLGAGAILRHQDNVKGLTTAATIWTVAAIGITAGFGFFIVAVVTTVVVLVALVVVGRIERRALRQAREEAAARSRTGG
jgi:putative Mg2+ transporter-C (MgtC) family protein